ncbi:MAG: hypothetical protein AAF495_00695 [Pseudomonadota bacterium]
MRKSPRFTLSRRDLMVLAPATAVTAGLSGVSGAALAGPGCGGAHTAKLAVAYLSGSETWAHLDGLSPTLEALSEDAEHDEAPLVTASSLASGDQAFAERSARISLHGLMSEPSADLPDMRLMAHFEPYHELTHQTWCYEGSGPNCGSDSGDLTLPIDPAHGMKLSLEVQTPDEETPAVAEANFAVGEAFGRPKLRRGAYLIAWDRPGGRQSSHPWFGLKAIVERVPEPSEGVTAVRRFMVAGTDATPLRVPALLMTVDFAET